MGIYGVLVSNINTTDGIRCAAAVGSFQSNEHCPADGGVEHPEPIGWNTTGSLPEVYSC